MLENCHEHSSHHHEADAHIWLSPENAMVMATNISKGLSALYPQHQAAFEANLTTLLQRLQQLLDYGKETLSSLACRELITFHDGFSYFAHSFDLTILKAIEEESGSEASAGELKEVIGIVRDHDLPAIFVEKSGADAAARIISREIGVPIFALDMAISGEDYFEAMYKNINTIKEALG
jgi:zinc transport system substrate-binding protein